MTTAQTEAQIHEFSTGIRPERTADGGWVSIGFTGQYMNATIDQIPHAVQRSIANKEFAVAEGAASDEPAIIGRVVSGKEESDWSVVAIVTRGRDEKGRSASLYRYFLCEGAYSLWKIVAWIEDYQELHNGELPIFNPFDTKDVDKPNLCTVSTPPQINLPSETETFLLNTSAPILIPPDSQYTLQVVSRLANKKVINDGNNQLVSWAFNVEALEQPGRFQIIQAASDRAYELLQKAKVSISQVSAPLIDEQAFKAAIKGLISSSTVKLDHVQAIADSLEHTQIPASYWKEIFDGQGATNALKQGIYSSQMVRLLTLRAIVIPETLPDYLNWLEKGNKQNDNHKVSTEFQSQLKNSLIQIPDTAKNIEVKITEGIRLLLPKLLEQKVSVETVSWLLADAKGLWAKFSRQVIQDIEHDLQLMSQFVKGSKTINFKLTDNTWQSIWNELKPYWRSRSELDEKYRTFAELFGNLCSYKLSVFFYHLCLGYGKVPKEIFAQICRNDWDCAVYGVLVKREVSMSDIPELLWNTIEELGSEIVPFSIVSMLSIFCLTIGILLGKFVPIESILNQGTQHSNSSQSTKQGSGNENVNIAKDVAKSDLIISKKEVIEAIDNFPATIKAIKNILNSFKKNVSEEEKPKIIQEAQRIFAQKINIKLTDLNSIINKTNQVTADKKMNLVNAIYVYQKQNKLDPVGYISERDERSMTQLKNDVNNQLKK